MSHTKNGKATKLINNHAGRGQNPVKILPDREPFIFQLRARGYSFPNIAEAFAKEYEPINPATIFYHIEKHKERFESFKAEFYANIKAIPIANATVRILELKEMADKLKKAIDKIINYEPRQWETLNMGSLIRAHKELLEQIQDEAGDKIQRMKGEGLPNSSQVFGDVIVNNYADKVIEERRKESVDPGNRVEAFGLSDFGNPISGN